jgi:MYXO-CTERM domain-containing protein
MRCPLPCAIVLASMLAPTLAVADETVLSFTGEVPDDAFDHFFVAFDVPAGIVEIEVRHDDLSNVNILDWGLEDPDGAFRGWGGGNTEPAIVGIEAASRSYVPGPITQGTWRVVVGKAKLEELPGQYEIEIVLREEPTLEAQPQRTPYSAPSPLRTEARWYAGDFHVHSRESGDAAPTLEQILGFAGDHGLDFLHIADHNVDTQLDFYDVAQSAHPDVLLLPGVEFTTYRGHALGIGAVQWVDHKIGLPGVTIEGAATAFAEQGALFAIAHPALDLGPFCIGCAWEHELPGELVHAVEIATGGLEPVGYLFVDNAIAFWDALCDEGWHVAPIGGSDDHHGGAGDGFSYSPIGNPTTHVWAESLDVASIVAGVAAGRTVVKLQGPGDPMVELAATDALLGDTVIANDTILHVRVTDGIGTTVRLVHNGSPADQLTVDADPFEAEVPISAPEEGEDRWRAELLVEGRRRVVTGHIWIQPDPDAAELDTGTGGADSGEHAADGGGCGCTYVPEPRASLGLVVLLALVRRRR